MALSKEDREESLGLLKEGFKEALKEYRSELEEEAAKNQQGEQDADKDKKGGKGDSNSRGGFLQRFLLGD